MVSRTHTPKQIRGEQKENPSRVAPPGAAGASARLAGPGVGPRTARPLAIPFREHGIVNLPAGLRVSPVPEPRGSFPEGTHFLDEFPEDVFPKNSMILHDAIHYGVVIQPQDVKGASSGSVDKAAKVLAPPVAQRAKATKQVSFVLVKLGRDAGRDPDGGLSFLHHELEEMEVQATLWPVKAPDAKTVLDAAANANKVAALELLVTAIRKRVEEGTSYQMGAEILALINGAIK